jgi:hypothetical protein
MGRWVLSSAVDVPGVEHRAAPLSAYQPM